MKKRFSLFSLMLACVLLLSACFGGGGGGGGGEDDPLLTFTEGLSVDGLTTLSLSTETETSLGVVLEAEAIFLYDGTASRYDYSIDRLLSTEEAIAAGVAVAKTRGWGYVSGNRVLLSDEGDRGWLTSLSDVKNGSLSPAEEHFTSYELLAQDGKQQLQATVKDSAIASLLGNEAEGITALSLTLTASASDGKLESLVLRYRTPSGEAGTATLLYGYEAVTVTEPEE